MRHNRVVRKTDSCNRDVFKICFSLIIREKVRGKHVTAKLILKSSTDV